MIPVCLTIAGSDPSGGAGIQADLKTFHQHQCYGMSVITLITVQNTCTVKTVHVLDAELVASQIKAVVTDIKPNCAKTGALGNKEVIEAIAKQAKDFQFPLIVDPVIISKHGLPLIEEQSVSCLVSKLIPLSFLLTPNIPEALALSKIKEISKLEDMKEAALKISELGAKNVLIKGGHLNDKKIDLLYCNNSFVTYEEKTIDTKNTHGTGCVLSAAITANIAKGLKLSDAIGLAKKFLTEAIRTNPQLGKGLGPINMLAKT